MDDKEQVRSVMKYFNCNEQMARCIIKASVQNGEIHRIQSLCEKDWKQKER